MLQPAEFQQRRCFCKADAFLQDSVTLPLVQLSNVNLEVTLRVPSVANLWCLRSRISRRGAVRYQGFFKVCAVDDSAKSCLNDWSRGSWDVWLKKIVNIEASTSLTEKERLSTLSWKCARSCLLLNRSRVVMKYT